MTRYAEYPEGLPLPQANFNGTMTTPTVTTSFESGRIRRRRTGRTSVKKATLEWLFSPDEYDLWEVFFRDGLNDGCEQFAVNMSTGGISQTGEHVVQCVGDYSFAHEECNWRVSVECVIYPYPNKNASDLLELYLGAPVADFTAVINHYYEQDYQQ